MVNAKGPAGIMDDVESYRQAVRQRLRDLFWKEVHVRRGRAEYLFRGRWVGPGDHVGLQERLGEESRRAVRDLVVLYILALLVGIPALLSLIRSSLLPR